MYYVISYNYYNYNIVIHVPALTPFKQIGNGELIQLKIWQKSTES